MQFRNLFNFVLSLVILFSFLSFVPFAYDVFAVFSVSLVVVKLAEWLMQGTRKFILYKTVCPKNKAVLITGCDSGFGNAAARRFDKLGYKVFAGCLNPEGEDAKTLIKNSEKLTVLPLDITDDQSVQEAKEFITKNLGQNVLWAVLNNAGIVHTGEIDWTPFEELQQVYNVNAAGSLRVIKAFLPLIKQSKGRIVNNNSASARFTGPAFVGYGMSKSAAAALTTGLRMELAKWGVRVISIEPFFYATPLTATKNTLRLLERTWKNAPEDTKEDYGDEYKETFKKNVAQCLYWCCNPNTFEVIDCFEDAITAADPLPTYFPCQFVYKAGIKLLLELPSVVNESIQRFLMDKGTKLSALRPKTK